jgi:predicted outer membrane repeat protein
MMKKIRTLLSVILLAAACLGAWPALGPGGAKAGKPVVLRVAEDGVGERGCGGDWKSPCSLVYALKALPDQIWVKAGTYLPVSTNSDPRYARFELPNGVAVYGGFGGSETELGQRDWVKNLTILSGDLERDDLANPATDTSQIVGSNAYRVVESSHSNGDSRLDGFTITAGYADHDPIQSGAGMVVYASCPVLRHLVFSGNYAKYSGGGMIMGEDLSLQDPFIPQNCTAFEDLAFFGNHAGRSGGGLQVEFTKTRRALLNARFVGNWAAEFSDPLNSYGAGMAMDEGQVTLTSATFEENQAAFGGGIFSFNSDLEINGASFSNNTAFRNGGGIDTYNSDLRIGGASFSGNSTNSWNGGALFAEDESIKGHHTSVLNTTFSGNQAEAQGGAVTNWGSELNITYSTIIGNTALGSGGGVVTEIGKTTITGSILWGNNSGQLVTGGDGSKITVTYSDIFLDSGVWPGAGNLNADPQLGKLDHYGSALIQTLPLLTSSPAIDAVPTIHCLDAQGAALVQDGRSAPRPGGAACDMGAHERSGTLSVFSGSGQNTQVNTAFPLPLIVSLASAYQDPLDGVQVTFNAPASEASALVNPAPLPITNGGTASRTAQANGLTGSYQVSVNAPGISPAFFNLSNTPLVYSISGRVAAAANSPIAGVNISDGAGHTALSGLTGSYTFSGLAPGTYTLTPSKAGYRFTPPSTQVIVAGASLPSIDFIARIDFLVYLPFLVR